MKRKVYSVRLSEAESAALAERNGNPGAGIRAALDAYLATPSAKTEIPADADNEPAAPVKVRKAKPVSAVQGPQLHRENAAPGAYRHRDRWCRPCLEAGQPACSSCRRAEGL